MYVSYIQIFPNIRDLRTHSKNQKHAFISKQIDNSSAIKNIFSKSTSDEVKYAELKLTVMLATNKLPFLFIDTLTKICADVIPDSTIVKNMS